MMVWAEGNEVLDFVVSAVGFCHYVMHVRDEPKAAHDTPMIVTDAGLCLEVFPAAALPAAVIHTADNRTMVRRLAEPIAEIVGMDLARIAAQLCPALVAIDDNLILPPLRRANPLPQAIALIISAGYLAIAWIGTERTAAYWADAPLFSASVVPVVLATMLMPIDKSWLLAWVARFPDRLTTTARTQ